MDLAFAAHAAPFTQRSFSGPALRGSTRRNDAYRAAAADQRRSRIIVSQEAPVEAVETVEAFKAKPIVKEEKKMRLQALMSKAGVASSETCGVMIENGFVRVNGDVVTDAKARVKKTDFILVRGKELLTDGAASDDDDDSDDLPRAQKDFGRTKALSTDKFNWRVDGGFLSSKAGGRLR